MSRFTPRCPSCGRELDQVTAREEDGPNPTEVACPHCAHWFNLEAALDEQAERIAEEEEEALQREFDKITRG